MLCVFVSHTACTHFSLTALCCLSMHTTHTNTNNQHPLPQTTHSPKPPTPPNPPLPQPPPPPYSHTARVSDPGTAGSPELTGPSPRMSSLKEHPATEDASPRAQPPHDTGAPTMQHMPPDPLALLRKMVTLIKVLVDYLRQKCLEEKVTEGPPGGGLSRSSSQTGGRGSMGEEEAGRVGGYSALTQAPWEWKQVVCVWGGWGWVVCGCCVCGCFVWM